MTIINIDGTLKEPWRDPGSAPVGLILGTYIDIGGELYAVHATQPTWRDAWAILRGRWHCKLSCKKLGEFESEMARGMIDYARDLNRQTYTED